MCKYFFYLSAGTHALEQSLGLEYMDAEGAKEHAYRMAREFRSDSRYQGYFVVVMDQRGNMVAEAPVASPDHHRALEYIRELLTT